VATASLVVADLAADAAADVAAPVHALGGRAAHAGVLPLETLFTLAVLQERRQVIGVDGHHGVEVEEEEQGHARKR
jgi:hypothetical protein